ncbi:MAG: hypothetical protein AAGC73_06820 [Verrucomicrobiota bacterium]
MIGIRDNLVLSARLLGGNRLADRVFTQAQSSHNDVSDRHSSLSNQRIEEFDIRRNYRRKSTKLIALPAISDELRSRPRSGVHIAA